MVKILALDSFSDRCTAAVLHDGNVIVRDTRLPRSHAQDILTLTEQALLAAKVRLDQLDALAVIAGPGSFTGLRIAISVVQGLALALEIPVILVSTLEALAGSARALSGATHVLVAMQARDNENYFAAFGPDQSLDETRSMVLWGSERVAAPSALGDMAPSLQGHSWTAIGDGWHNPDSLLQALGVKPVSFLTSMELDMRVVCELAVSQLERGQWVAPEQALPRYLKEHMDYRTT